MRFSSAALLATSLSALLSGGSAFVSPTSSSRAAKDVTFLPSARPAAYATSNSRLFSTTEEEKTETKEVVAETKGLNGESSEGEKGNEDGLPWWWELVWDLEIMKKGEPGTDCTFGDSANVLRTNIEQIYGDYPSLDGCPLAEGEITDIADGTMFIGLQRYSNEYGSPYKLCFGPKSFLVISDPVQARHVLKEANTMYDKGLLAEILKPIMGKGLIPADPVTWSVRRRAIVPAFHKAWLNHMVGLFGYCNTPLIASLEKIADGTGKVDMEEKFCSVALDIIGKSVFNYEFGSVTDESPVIKAVYSALVEAEHRSMTPAPYWDLPFANQVVPRLRKFNSDLRLLNDVLDDLINRAKSTRAVADIEELEKRNYDNVEDPSLLRFLVDMRGADIDNKQLRDDLMTMLIAGHETTAAVLTWALFELSKNQEIMKKARDEIDRVVGDRTPTLEDIKEMKYLRLIVAETLRMYPEPPLLIRRCREENVIPKGGGREATCIRGMDMFISLYNIHRDGRFWPNPDTFEPERFERKYVNPDIEGWKGYDPEKWKGQLYPNEIASDFAFLPFGGGARKCIGDEFATLEATVTLAMVLRRFEFDFDPAASTSIGIDEPPMNLEHPVGMRTGATIHTRQGLNMIVKRRSIE
uniref:Cytochrome P450 n=1 Tax=Ditylum brightwellii TaxID=49249 RepID=A0A6V2CV31_9STRA|mmetsp:Transcript_11546/g.17146  ORF Transcript_11546/g.17146 Transcript_11546/m.17146 type:complete len:639 (-) Transcript_11546:159-2075(-)